MPEKPSALLHRHRPAIRQVIGRYRVCNPRVFGSVVRGSDTEGSDLDILVDPTDQTTLYDIGALRQDLGRLLGVRVDVLTPDALPDPVREQVLAQAQPL